MPKLLVEPPTEDEIKKLFGCLNTRTKIGARDYAILLLFLDSWRLQRGAVHLAAQHLAVINERVSPMDKVKIKTLNGPYRKADP
jgi:hypothetical protein